MPTTSPQTLETFGGQSSIVQDSWDTVLSKFTDLEVRRGKDVEGWEGRKDAHSGEPRKLTSYVLSWGYEKRT